MKLIIKKKKKFLLLIGVTLLSIFMYSLIRDLTFTPHKVEREINIRQFNNE